MTRNTLLLDGDLIAYRIAAALETPINWGNGLWTLHCYEDECNKAFVHKVESIKADTGLNICPKKHEYDDKYHQNTIDNQLDFDIRLKFLIFRLACNQGPGKRDIPE